MCRHLDKLIFVNLQPFDRSPCIQFARPFYMCHNSRIVIKRRINGSSGSLFIRTQNLMKFSSANFRKNRIVSCFTHSQCKTEHQQLLNCNSFYDTQTFKLPQMLYQRFCVAYTQHKALNISYSLCGIINFNAMHLPKLFILVLYPLLFHRNACVCSTQRRQNRNKDLN